MGERVELPRAERCETCRYWWPHFKSVHDGGGSYRWADYDELEELINGAAGKCHRYPPGIYPKPESSEPDSEFPPARHGDWCGEWRAKG
jgi:hypothetical protein